ncbi:MAG: hypothetical protein ACREMZ_17230, partial [Gemmatimonadales bacterium]
MTLPILGGKTRALSISVIVLVGLLAFPAVSSAQVVTTWTGATSTDWDVDTNWTEGQPEAADTAVIDNTSPNNPTVSTAGEVATAVNLSGSKQLTVSGVGDLDVSGQITAPAGTNVSLTGGLLEFGTLLVDNAAGFTATGGEFAGILDATTATTYTIDGASYGTTGSNGVTLDPPVSVTQSADVTMQGTEFLNINAQLYTLDDVDILEAASAGTTITITSGGTLFHNGGADNVVQPDIDSSGTIHTATGIGSLTLVSNGGGNTNQLGGTLQTAGNGAMFLATDGTGDTYTVKAGGLTVNNPSGQVELIGGTGFDFDLNAQTVSLNGDLTWDGTLG